MVEKAQRFVRDEQWPRQFLFVEWFSDWLVTALRWVGSCLCHAADYEARVPITCSEKGRLITRAHQYSETCFSDGLRLADNWSPADFLDCSHDFLQAVKGVVRLVVGVGRKKLLFLDRAPFLIARLDEDGVVARILNEYDASSPDQRDDVSSQFLAEGSAMRQYIVDFQSSGVMAPELSREIQALRDIPFCDIVCEAPHAHAKRITGAARSSNWPWLASSVRIDQNLTDAAELPGQTGADIQWL